MSARKRKVCKSCRRLFCQGNLYTIEGYYQCRDCVVVFDGTNQNEEDWLRKTAHFSKTGFMVIPELPA